MSCYVYLTKEGVKNLLGFKEEFASRVSDGGSIDCGTSNINITRSKGRWYLFLPDINDKIPDEVKVEEISFRWTISGPKREAGIYRHNSAEAEIETPNSHGNAMVKMIARNIDDLRKLYHLIRTGKIHPNESYEVPQGGKSRAELEHEIKYLLDEKERKIIQLCNISLDLQRRLFPLMRIKNVLEEINSIISDK